MSDEKAAPDPRRRRRSEETQQAITFQLEHVRDEFSMDLLLLADEHGLILAYAGDEQAAETFAVFSPSLAKGDPPDRALFSTLPGLEPAKILCETISLDEIPLYLCAVMDPTPENCRAYERVRTGIQRIYYSTSELASELDGQEE